MTWMKEKGRKETKTVLPTMDIEYNNGSTIYEFLTNQFLYVQISFYMVMETLPARFLSSRCTSDPDIGKCSISLLLSRFIRIVCFSIGPRANNLYTIDSD